MRRSERTKIKKKDSKKEGKNTATKSGGQKE
jgi:hypothetical protein